MSKPKDEIEFAELHDEEDRLYLFVVDQRHTARFLDTLSDRIMELFDHAEAIVMSGEIESDSTVVVSTIEGIESEEFEDIEISEIHKQRLKEMAEGSDDAN